MVSGPYMVGESCGRDGHVLLILHFLSTVVTLATNVRVWHALQMLSEFSEFGKLPKQVVDSGLRRAGGS